MVGQTVLESRNPGKKRPTKEVIVNWEERTVDESFEACRTFARDLTNAIESRLDSSVNAASSSFFDIVEILKLLCGKRLPDGRVKLQEGDLEEYGVEEFREYFKEVCSLEHIKELEDERFDARLYASVLRSFKQALRVLVWDHELKHVLISCFRVVKNQREDNNDRDSSPSCLDGGGELLQMDVAEQPEHIFLTQCDFILQFAGKEPVKAQLLEEEVIKALYCNELLYAESAAGKVAMTAFDIGLAMGGPEAIAESFYSVMDTQRQHGGQNHGTLEERTLLDWASSNVIQSEKLIRRAAIMYLDGKKDERLSRHRVGNLRKTSEESYKASKVLTRFANVHGRYPFLKME